MRNTDSYFVSWSGGKDSCLALFRATKKYGKPKYLINMLTEDGCRSRSHGLSKTILEKQASLLQIPILFYAATWNDYESVFINALHNLKREGIEIGVFGDIKINDWADQMCKKTHIICDKPLWDEREETLLHEFFEAGFVAKIISVNATLLSREYLGRTLNSDLIGDFLKQGINPAGEKGEYHTLVLDGPMFKNRLNLEEKECILKNGYWFLDVNEKC